MDLKKVSIASVVQDVRVSNHFITLFFQEKGTTVRVELRNEVFRDARKPKKGDFFEMEQTFQNGCLIKSKYTINNQTFKPKPLRLIKNKIMEKTTRTFDVLFIEKVDSKVVIHPRFANQFALPQALFPDGLPQSGEQITVEENEHGGIVAVYFRGERLNTRPTPGIRP